MVHRVTASARILALTYLLSIIISPVTLLGQSTAATILGTVSDETGAMLPGVTVLITNTETGISRTVVTDDRGRYIAPQLALGTQYEVRAELQGFKTTIRRGIGLAVGSEAVVDLRLTVGEVTEDIVVTASAALVETTTAMVSGHIASGRCGSCR